MPLLIHKTVVLSCVYISLTFLFHWHRDLDNADLNYYIKYIIKFTPVKKINQRETSAGMTIPAHMFIMIKL